MREMYLLYCLIKLTPEHIIAKTALYIRIITSTSTTNSVWNEIVTSCTDLASYNARDTIRQLEYAGVTYVQGAAAFADSGGSSSLFVTDSDNFITTLNAEKVLIATGSTPFRPGGIPFDGKRKCLLRERLCLCRISLSLSRFI